MTIEVRMNARPVHPVSVVEAKARFSECVREAEAGGVETKLRIPDSNPY